MTSKTTKSKTIKSPTFTDMTAIHNAEKTKATPAKITAVEPEEATAAAAIAHRDAMHGKPEHVADLITSKKGKALQAKTSVMINQSKIAELTAETKAITKSNGVVPMPFKPTFKTEADAIEAIKTEMREVRLITRDMDGNRSARLAVLAANVQALHTMSGKSADGGDVQIAPLTYSELKSKIEAAAGFHKASDAAYTNSMQVLISKATETGMLIASRKLPGLGVYWFEYEGRMAVDPDTLEDDAAARCFQAIGGVSGIVYPYVDAPNGGPPIRNTTTVVTYATTTILHNHYLATFKDKKFDPTMKKAVKGADENKKEAFKLDKKTTPSAVLKAASKIIQTFGDDAPDMKAAEIAAVFDLATMALGQDAWQKSEPCLKAFANLRESVVFIGGQLDQADAA